MLRRSLIGLAAFVAVVGVAGFASAQAIDSARRDIEEMHYDRAESRLVEIAKRSGGDEKQEALFLLAGLKKSVSEAKLIYEEVERIDRNSHWSELATVEIAKIEYALGNYGESLNMLQQSGACRESEEGCYFQGLSAIMLQRYDDARQPLERVRSGKYRAWAVLSLAEAEMHGSDPEAACRRYRSMSRAGINPTGMYRYGECLEKQGEVRDAKEVFNELIDAFPMTPEALLAEEKLAAFSKAEKAPAAQEAPVEAPPPTTGFTIQFGAFQDRANAIRLAAELKRRLPGIRIDSSVVNHQEIHRVRLGQFRTRAEAQARADALQREIDEPFTIMMLP